MKGFSLIELMITLSVLLLIALSVGKFMPVQQKMETLSADAAQNENSEQIIFQLIIPEIHHAGYWGCQSAFNNTIPFLPLSGFNTQTGFPAEIKNNREKNNDVLWINRTAVPQFTISAQEKDIYFVVPKALEIKKGDELVITDCLNSEIVHVKSIQENHVYFEHDEKLKHSYHNAFITVLESSYFYLGNTGRQDKTGAAIYALYRQPVLGNRQELIEGVQELKFDYKAEREFVPAHRVTNWKKVKQVKITAILNNKIITTEAALRNANSNAFSK